MCTKLSVDSVKKMCVVMFMVKLNSVNPCTLLCSRIVWQNTSPNCLMSVNFAPLYMKASNLYFQQKKV